MGEVRRDAYTLGSLKLRTRQYMVLHDNHIYTCTFMKRLASHWETYAAAIEASRGDVSEWGRNEGRERFKHVVTKDTKTHEESKRD